LTDRAWIVRETDNRDPNELVKMLEAQIEALKRENTRLRKGLDQSSDPEPRFRE